MHRYVLTGLLALLLFAGCRTTDDLSATKNEGTAHVYAVSAQEAIVLSVDVLAFFFPEVDTDGSGYITATSVGALQGAWSSAAVWVEPLGPDRSRVTVTAKRWSGVQIPIRMTEYQFHKALGLTRVD